MQQHAIDSGRARTRPNLTRIQRRAILVCLGMCWVCAGANAAAATKLAQVEPEQVGMRSDVLAKIDDIVAKGLAEGQMPGCVVAVGRHGRLAFKKAYGFRQTQPKSTEMTTDTLFDLASLTKPIATATSVMILMERGQVRLRNRVIDYVPEFGQNGKERIKVVHLLTHQGGLPADNSLEDYLEGPDKAMERVFAVKTVAEPGEKFIYSDVGMIVLGELVKRVSGKNLRAFTHDEIFDRLGMTETGFCPAENLRSRAAPTEQRDGKWIQGEVHDPRAYRLEGVAGHAGLFSTADDLAVFAQMFLNRGQYDGVRILSPLTVDLMTSPLPVSSGVRGLGWDIRTGYSSNRGELLSSRAFGHGGFTGTAMWIDPGLDLFVIFLSNRVHPDGHGSVNDIAGRIGTVAAAAIDDMVHSPPPAVLTGIDVLERDDFRQLAERRVGIITNQTGINRDGVSTIQLLHDAPNVCLVALFSPEHGIEGKLEISRIADGQDDHTGLPIFSLFGQSRKPSPESLTGIDTLVFDIQDIGTRFYTYISTMGLAMQAASEQKIRFVVLDRPNPINGVDVEGPVLDSDSKSFTGFHEIPIRHGMTVGELALMFKAELELPLDLQVIRMEGWRREDHFDATGLLWVNPSPNMRSLSQALLYPGIGLLETTNLSVGRGTDTPFEVIGAPWIDGRTLADALRSTGLPGVRFVPIQLTPDASKFQGKRCGGVNIVIVDRNAFRSVRTGLTIARTLRRLYPEQWDAEAYARLLRNRSTHAAVLAQEPTDKIIEGYRPGVEEFLKRRTHFLLYR